MLWQARRGWISGRGALDAGSAPAPTLDSSNKDSGLALSGGNLTATQSGAGNRSVTSTTSHSSGKFYLEVTISQGNGGLGFANSSFNVSGGVIPGTDAGDAVGSQSSGATAINNSSIGSAWGWIAGDTLGIAVDFTGQKIWYKDLTFAQPWNNNGSADPATGVGGFSLATLAGSAWFAVVCLGVNAETGTINFGATAYTGTAPSGFGNW